MKFIIMRRGKPDLVWNENQMNIWAERYLNKYAIHAVRHSNFCTMLRKDFKDLGRR